MNEYVVTTHVIKSPDDQPQPNRTRDFIRELKELMDTYGVILEKYDDWNYYEEVGEVFAGRRYVLADGNGIWVDLSDLDDEMEAVQ